jgi:hypothetical protein
MNVLTLLPDVCYCLGHVELVRRAAAFGAVALVQGFTWGVTWRAWSATHRPDDPRLP